MVDVIVILNIFFEGNGVDNSGRNDCGCSLEEMV